MSEVFEKTRRLIPAAESYNRPELFRATLGFDFVFTKDESGALECFCIEINGHRSGIHGMQKLSKTHRNTTHGIMVDVRSRLNLETIQKLERGVSAMNALEEFNLSNDLYRKIVKTIRKETRKNSLFVHAYFNPDFIEKIANDKTLQAQYIPKEHAPRQWRKGDSHVSSTGLWVAKGKNSSGGRMVQVYTNDTFKDFLAFAEKEKLDLEKAGVIQELIPAAGALRTRGNRRNHCASMRFLIDFRYLKDGTIVPTFITSYQRVAPFPKTGVPAKGSHIVNFSSGSYVAQSSKKERAMAFSVAQKIIHNIGEAYEKSLPDELLREIMDRVLPKRTREKHA